MTNSQESHAHLQQQEQSADVASFDLASAPLNEEDSSPLLQQQTQLHGVVPVVNQSFPRPTVKRRKPVKWEPWEEKNLIDGVRRYGRGMFFLY
jgi:hypothetical protein